MKAASQWEDLVYEAALKVEDPAGRKVFLDQACVGDAELRTAVEHAVVLSRGDRISLRDLPAALRAGVPAPASARASTQPDLTVAEAEKQLIVRALKEGGGNRTLAAQKLGMSRRTLHRKLHCYHLEGI